MQLLYNDHIIELFDDNNYDPRSTDNSIKYDQYYSNDDPNSYYLTQHGIRISDMTGEVLNQVCIAASGGSTGIHEHCCVILDHTLSICCADSVFSLTLPDLVLKWQTKADEATCFEIFSYQDDFIIHGELEISRLDGQGAIIWQFSGNDIFLTPTGKEGFAIKNNIIYATNWDNVTFMIDADTGRELGDDTK